MAREMKDSGIEWIGEIPATWKLSKVKNNFTRKKSKALLSDPVVLSLARSGVKVRDLSNNEGQIAESYYEYNPVAIGDLLLNPMDLYSGANCSISKVEGVISPAYINLKSKEGVNPVFFDYYFKHQYWCMAFFAHGEGVSFDNRWTLNNETLMNYPIVLPSEKEQNNIVSFLDSKCAEIDKAIDATKASIEEYKKLRQAIITEAVTKGLDPDVEMKDSGVKWIRNIKTTWKVLDLKYCLKEPLKYGDSESGVEYDEKLPRYIRITDIDSDGHLKDDNKLSLTEKQAEGYILKNNSLLFARSGATVGKAFLYTESLGRSAFAGYLILAVTNNKIISPHWLLYYTQSSIYKEWCSYIFNQATIQNIGADKYANLPITVPSIEEQKSILSYLDTKCTEIDSLIKSKEKLIEELTAYRKSLIYEYVTGKKEVPTV